MSSRMGCNASTEAPPPLSKTASNRKKSRAASRVTSPVRHSPTPHRSATVRGKSSSPVQPATTNRKSPSPVTAHRDKTPSTPREKSASPTPSAPAQHSPARVRDCPEVATSLDEKNENLSPSSPSPERSRSTSPHSSGRSPRHSLDPGERDRLGRLVVVPWHYSPRFCGFPPIGPVPHSKYKLERRISHHGMPLDSKRIPQEAKIIVLGGPGSGKTTQCEEMVRNYGFVHISTGDLLLAEMKKKTSLGNRCEASMREGKLVSAEIPMFLLRLAMDRYQNKHFLIEGFPRSLEQARMYEDKLDKPDLVIYLDCPLKIMEERLLKQTEQSDENRRELVKRKLLTFRTESMPVLKFFDKSHGLLKSISSNHPPDQVFMAIANVIEERFGLRSKIPARITIFVLGGPGCGKGTQCEEIVQKFGFIHLSAGDLLRSEIRRKTAIGASCESLMREGKLVPPQIPLALVKSAMEKSQNKHFLIDGFPRAVEQARIFEEKTGKPDLVIYLDCPLEVMEERLLKRGETSGRSDDNAETIRKRFETYQAESLPVVEYYQQVPGLLQQISAAQTTFEIFREIADTFKKRFGIVPKATDKTVVFILGAPGSGKGTQCNEIVKKYGFVHLSTGDLLRAEIRHKTTVGTSCEALLKEGKLVPSEIPLNLLKLAMEKSLNKLFLIDGFPRTIDQAKAFEEKIGKPDLVIHLDCPFDMMEDRLIDHGLTSGRSDDNAQAIRKRFEIHRSESVPMIRNYEQTPGMFRQISSIDPPDEVFWAIANIFKQRFGIYPTPTIVFILGGPGSGKSTQCERIVQHYGFIYISIDELMKAEISNKTEAGAAYEALGRFAPVDIALSVIKSAMDKSLKKMFLIDVCSRAIEQAEAFEAKIGLPDLIIHLDCSLNVMEDRLLKRGETSGSDDDSVENVKKKLQTYQTEFVPVVKYFQKNATNLIRQVSGERSADEVFVDIAQAFSDGLGLSRKVPSAITIFVIGTPGCGKGTQCEQIVNNYGFTLLSVDDLVRAEIENKTDLGARCEALTKEGKILSAEISLDLLKREMENSRKKHFVVDGFPRALEQATAYEDKIGSPDLVIYLDCPFNLMEERLLERGLRKGRADENPQTIKKRFDTYKIMSAPVLQHYEKKADLLKQMSSANPSNEVFLEIAKVLDKRFGLAKKSVVFMLGGPGCGKGTQCDRIVKHYGFVHLSVGDLLRREIRNKTEIGKSCEELMKEGKLVPAGIPLDLLKSVMIRSQRKFFLIDGFPRAVEQATAYQQQLGIPDLVIYLDCPLDVMEERLLKRGETSGRSDDNAETIKKRFDTYHEESMPVIEHFQSQPGLLKQISSAYAPDDVFWAIAETFKERFGLTAKITSIFVLGGPGCGKGTQCTRILKSYGFVHLSVGDLLRAEIRNQTEIGVSCETLMKEGKLVPSYIPLGLLKSAMDNSRNKFFLIDGFPRSLEQARAYEEQIGKPDLVIYLDCPLEAMEARLLKRGKTSGRCDDNAETIRKRFDTYRNESMPVIQHYEKEHGLLQQISSVHAPDDVFSSISLAIEERFGLKAKTPTTTVFVLGGPGCGKGTQCERMVKSYGFVHLSAGDLLRAEIKNNTTIGNSCEMLMKEGKLVPAEIPLALLKAAMDKSRRKLYLIDGFPRSLEQAKAYEEKIGKPDLVIYLDCPLNVMEARLLKRGQTSGRSDDNAKTIKARFETYNNESMPVIQHYEEQGGSLLKKISSAYTPDEIFAAIAQTFKKSFGLIPRVPTTTVFVLGGPGCGKGTLCENIMNNYGFVHLSVGDLLRTEIKNKTPIGSSCEELMKEGKLVPTEIPLALLKSAMDQSQKKMFLVDGFPRALDQARAYETIIGDPDSVIYLDCPLNVMEERLLKRGETSGRSDDNAVTIRKRFETYCSESMPLIQYYEKYSGLLTQISAADPPEKVFSAVVNLFKEKFGLIAKPQKPPTKITIFVLGGPGCGKGTQCEQIVSNYGFVHLSAGDLLRGEIKNRTLIGTILEAIMKEGKLVPTEIPLTLLKSAIDASEKKLFLIDGFPRSLEQAKAFETKIGKPSMVIYLDCPLTVMEERLLKRAETSGRSDDNPDTIRKRFETYTKESMPLIKYYQNSPGLLKQISSAQSPTEVFLGITNSLRESFGLVSKSAVAGPIPFDHSKHDCLKATIIYVLGGPGCGKGTQCDRMVREFGYTHLSTGDLLRAEVKSGSLLGLGCDALMKEGQLVPLDVTINLLKQAMDKAHCKRFLIDGFPRTLEQAQEFEAKVAKPNLVVCLECSMEVMQKRLIERGKASGRSDDNPETIKKRFETFVAESEAVLGHYKTSAPDSIKMISSEKLAEEVYAEVKSVLMSSVEKP